MDIPELIRDLLIVLSAGTVSGVVCKKFNVSLLVGYLLVGAVIGRGGLGLVTVTGDSLEAIAEAGVLMLLFSIGIEFPLDELAKLRRFIFMGGPLQMLLVAAPLALAAWLAGMSINGAILAGVAGALSSTVLVFRALTEAGEASAAHGRRAVAVLLFQDLALVPLLLLIPLLSGRGDQPTLGMYGLLAVKSLLFLVGIWGLQQVFGRFAVPVLVELRSVELIVLITLSLLCALSSTAYWLGLPPAIGALAAGITLSGSRLSKQIDSIVLPFRESFAAVFFVTLGMLLQPATFLKEPFLLTAGMIGIVLLKTLASGCALRAVGLAWRPALGMGLALSQLGEFSFLLVARGVSEKLLTLDNYNRMLLIALATLILTPLFLRVGLRWAGKVDEDETGLLRRLGDSDAIPRAVVIGIGPIGGQVASRLETMGVDVTLMDLSPINLHPFAQLGFHTIVGDARELDVLKRNRVHEFQLAVVSVAADDVALEIVRSLRKASQLLSIVVRCRFQSRAGALEKAGANAVVSEEAEASGPVIRFCEKWMESVH